MSLLACFFLENPRLVNKLPYCSEIWHVGFPTQIKIIGEIVFFYPNSKRGSRGSLRSDFYKIIDQSNVNGFSWKNN